MYYYTEKIKKLNFDAKGYENDKIVKISKANKFHQEIKTSDYCIKSNSIIKLIILKL